MPYLLRVIYLWCHPCMLKSRTPT